MVLNTKVNIFRFLRTYTWFTQSTEWTRSWYSRSTEVYI